MLLIWDKKFGEVYGHPISCVWFSADTPPKAKYEQYIEKYVTKQKEYALSCPYLLNLWFSGEVGQS